MITIAEALIFRGQDELSENSQLSRLAHIADLIDRIGAAGDFENHSRDDPLAQNHDLRQRVTGLARNDIAAGVAESAPRWWRPHHNSTAPTLRLQFKDPLKGPVGSGLDIIMAYDSRGRHLPLAARPRVGHIGLTGAVAEWLKAAVC
jgi:hypothetical protein